MAPAYNFNLPTRADDPRNPQNYGFLRNLLFAAIPELDLRQQQARYDRRYDQDLARAMFARAQGGTAETAGTAQTFPPGVPKQTMQIEDFGPRRFGPAPEEPPLVRPTMRAGQEQESLIGTQVPIPMRRPYIPSDEKQESVQPKKESALTPLEKAIMADPFYKAGISAKDMSKKIGTGAANILHKITPERLNLAITGQAQPGGIAPQSPVSSLMQVNKPTEQPFPPTELEKRDAIQPQSVEFDPRLYATQPELDPAIGIGADSPEVPMLAPPPGTEQIAVTAQRPSAIDAQQAPPMDVVPQGLEPQIGQAPSAMGTVVADQRDMAGIPTLAPVPMQRPEPLGPVPVFGDIEAASASVAAPGMQAEPEEIRRGRETVRQFNVNARKPTSDSAIKPLNINTLSYDALRVLSAMPEPMQRFIQGLPSREEEKRKSAQELAKILGTKNPQSANEALVQALESGRLDVDGVTSAIDIMTKLNKLTAASSNNSYEQQGVLAIANALGGDNAAETIAEVQANYENIAEGFGFYDQVGELVGSLFQPLGLDVFFGQETRNATRKIRDLNNKIKSIELRELAGVGRVFADMQQNVAEILPMGDRPGIPTGDSEATAISAYTSIRDGLFGSIERTKAYLSNSPAGSLTPTQVGKYTEFLGEASRTALELEAMIAGLERGKFWDSSDRTTTDPVDVTFTNVGPRAKRLTEYFEQ